MEINNIEDMFQKWDGNHGFIQPHLDDLAFSISYYLYESAEMRKKQKAFTIFGREVFNIRGYDLNRGTEAILNEEENRWFQHMGMKFTRYPIQEAGLRGVTGIRNLFMKQRQEEFDMERGTLCNEVLGEVEKALQEIITSQYISYLWIPAGIGGHCDHLLVRQCAIEAARNSLKIKGLIFYEELPYKMYSKKIDWAKVIIEGFRRVDELRVVPNPKRHQQKKEGIKLYESQINNPQIHVMANQEEVLSLWRKE